MTEEQLQVATREALGLAHYYARVYRVEAEDFVQEGLLALHRRADRFDPARGTWRVFCRGWLRQGMTRYGANHCRLIRVPEHAMRKATQEGRCLPNDVLHFGLLTDEAKTVVDYADDRPSAERLLLDADRVRMLHEAIETLPATQREALAAIYWDEQTQRAAGQRLGVSKQAIFQRLEGAHANLRRRLEAA